MHAHACCSLWCRDLRTCHLPYHFVYHFFLYLYTRTGNHIRKSSNSTGKVPYHWPCIFADLLLPCLHDFNHGTASGFQYIPNNSTFARDYTASLSAAFNLLHAVLTLLGSYDDRFSMFILPIGMGWAFQKEYSINDSPEVSRTSLEKCCNMLASCVNYSVPQYALEPSCTVNSEGCQLQYVVLVSISVHANTGLHVRSNRYRVRQVDSVYMVVDVQLDTSRTKCSG